MDFVLDNTDMHILQLMQENARIPNVDMARKLDMAPSAVLERVKKLEQRKVIRHYTTNIDPAAVAQKLLAFIFIKSTDGLGCSTTAKALSQIAEVQEVHHIAGEDCFLVKVRTADSASLVALMRNEFAGIGTIQSTKTTIVLETIKEEQKLQIPTLKK
ncbi:MAG TPA: Lrp/AsnC family transcriptional regulator [Puia sp.]|jgi:Lrp/AsnC family leucine-responsive transcriptional regulator